MEFLDMFLPPPWNHSSAKGNSLFMYGVSKYIAIGVHAAVKRGQEAKVNKAEWFNVKFPFWFVN